MAYLVNIKFRNAVLGIAGIEVTSFRGMGRAFVDGKSTPVAVSWPITRSVAMATAPGNPLLGADIT